MRTTPWNRLNGRARIAGLDLARGLAVVGMLGAHLLYTGEGWNWTEPSSWVAIVDGRSSILFATLAGVSIGLVTGGTTPLGFWEMKIARGRLAARAGVLWVAGALLMLTGVPVSVILPAYAILFVLMLPFTALRNPLVLVVALGVGLVTPWLFPALDAVVSGSAEIVAVTGWDYPFPVWIAFLLAGLGVARAGITQRVVQWRMLGAGSALAALGYSLAVLIEPGSGYFGDVWTAEPHSSGLLEVIGSGGFAIAVLGACLLLATRAEGELTFFGWIALPLRAVGAMPLSAYTAQLLIWAVVAAAVLGDTGDLHGFRALEPFWPMTLAVVAGCTAWALLIGRGPLEWASDRITRLDA